MINPLWMQILSFLIIANFWQLDFSEHHCHAQYHYTYYNIRYRDVVVTVVV